MTRRHPSNDFRLPNFLDENEIVPASLLALTNENWRTRNLFTAVSRYRRVNSHASKTHHHPILFRGQWAMPVDSYVRPTRSEFDTSYYQVVESMQLLGHAVQACERDPQRPWPRYPIAVYDDAGYITHTQDLLTLEDGRAFYDTWAEEELREHALRHDFLHIFVTSLNKAKVLTKEANDLVAAGKSDAVPVAEYKRLTELGYATVTDDRAVALLNHDPNLLKSIPPVSSTTLASGAIGRQGTREWAVIIILTSNVPCTLSVRNVTVNLLEQTLHADTTGPLYVGANPRGRSVILRVKVTSELYGDFIAHIDATPLGNRDPIATIDVTLNEPEPAPTPEPEPESEE